MRDWHAYVRDRLRLQGLTPAREAEAIEEIARQLEDVARDARAAGASEGEAEAMAERHVPDWPALAREIEHEDRRGAIPLEHRCRNRVDDSSEPSRFMVGFAGDLLYAVRILNAQRSFTLIAALTLALGVGASSALFSVVNAVLLEPLPFRDPDRLVRLTSLRTHGQPGGISYPDFLDWRARRHAFDAMGVYMTRSFAVREAEGVSMRRGAVVNAELLAMLGAPVTLGRGFSPSEDGPGNAALIVLSDRFWHEHFGGDRSAIGQRMEIDHKPAIVIGVMAPGFEFPIDADPAQFWTTIAVDARSLASQRGVHYLDGIARLRPGTTLEQAQSELGAIVDAMNREHPENDPRGVRVRPELTELVADVRGEWLALFGAAGSLFLIASANVVNMLLARSAARQRELAIRFALGAGRLRLVRQLLTEHAVLGAAGAAASLIVAGWFIALLKRAAPPDVPRLEQASLNPRVLLFAAALSIVAVIIFGLLPALRGSAHDPARSARLGMRGSSGAARAPGALVAVQIAIAMVLLVGGGLLFGTVMRLQRVDPGFPVAGAVTVRIDLPDEYPVDRERIFYAALLDRLRATPGIAAATAAYAVPFSDREFNTGVEVEGRPAETGTHDQADFNIAQPGILRRPRHPTARRP